MKEVGRMLNFKGFCMIGATSLQWRQNKIAEQLEQLEKDGIIEILSLQVTEFNDIKSLYYICLVRGT
jgi:hypothetical protein